MAGPLTGLRIVELGGIGPTPFCGMMLADHGAEVVRIDRPGTKPDPRDPLMRSRLHLGVDLKSSDGVALVRALAGRCDGVIEGFRPGVADRLGLGPDVLLSNNPKLVYGRMTGWGQTGPLADTAGHDINYIALSGILHTVGTADGGPVPPVNYLGDFGGGAMILAFGMVSALLAVQRGGDGDIIDCAMTDGSALLAAMTRHFTDIGWFQDRPGVNPLDGGAHFYNVYECADGRHIAVGAIEPGFYRDLLTQLGLADDPAFRAQMKPQDWPALKARLAALFKTKTRQAWCDLLEGSDACFAPVLSLAEAPEHPHNRARETFVAVGDALQPAPAPRYTHQRLAAPRPGAQDGAEALLEALGYGAEQVAALREAGVLR